MTRDGRFTSPTQFWEDAYLRYTEAARVGLRDVDRVLGVLGAQLPSDTPSHYAWAIAALRDDERKWFVAALLDHARRAPKSLRHAMILAAVCEPDISCSARFIEPVVRVDRSEAARMLLDLVAMDDPDRAARAIDRFYWIGIASLPDDACTMVLERLSTVFHATTSAVSQKSYDV